MHVLDFLTESQNTEVSITSLKSDCTTGALLANSQPLQNTQKETFSWSLCLLESKSLDWRVVALEKKGQFRKHHRALE